ncbi:hypothetical protein C5167_042763 [Papaver somniferum]|uniref:RING-type E3 ubiquitin transferase n=1 Tax=Papaver somniferum TaxID=3469 RepID=A0A4Y7L6C8_PAPSO|nr:E3 ubiquitin-protein ligase MPSR1-like [Papaver somniferum]RZC80192.1 hypothetical protein C5167_042763 [Papaver somniferum]
MAANSESEANFLEQLISSRNRDISFFLPFLFGLSSSSPEGTNNNNPNPNQETGGRNQERIILINPFTQGMIVIEGGGSGGGRGFEDFLREISEKQGLAPATKASIDAMPKVVITEEMQRDLECSICLDGFESGTEAREMPCKHKYHGNCIEKWLGIHGNCPVCRFEMPVDEDDQGMKRNTNNGGAGGEEPERGERRGVGEIWVTLSVTRRNPSSSTNSDVI